MSTPSSRSGGDYHRNCNNSNQPSSYRQPYDDRSQQAGPSTRPYYSPSHNDRSQNRYDSYTPPSHRSWDQQRQPPYPAPDRYEPSREERRRDGWVAEPVRTQSGHDHFYDQTYGTDRYAWASDRYDPSYRTYDTHQPAHRSIRPPSQQRSYSTQSYRRDEEDRYRPSAPARPSTQNTYPSNRRVSELVLKKDTTAYLPPHRRGQSAPVADDTSQPPPRPLPPWRTGHNSPAPFSYGDTSFDTPTSSYRHKQEFVITLPSPRYIALSDPARAPPSRAGLRTKLLVLDLNGALIYRDKRTGDKRRSFSRPYLASFLEYLFLPEPVIDGRKRERPWEVFVWSSAQPHNVRAMVEGCFGMKWVEGVWEDEADEQKQEREMRGEGRLLGVWARDKLGLDEKDYSRKVQTVKDLRVLSEHLTTLPPPPDQPNSPLDFDESNIVLLDDSPLKAIHQPWNEIILPEYEKEGYQTSKSAAELYDDEGYGEGMDDALLCVIGMLEEMKEVQNVPQWIRGGGLTPSAGTETSPPAISVTPLLDPTLDSLPTHSSFIHWHSVPDVRSYWLARGLEALQRKGIEIRHGIDPAMPSTPGGRSPMWSAPGSSGRPSKEMIRMNNDEISIDGESDLGSPKQKQRGGWSPSRRNTLSPSPMPHSPPIPGPLPLLPMHPMPSPAASPHSHPLPLKPVSQYRSQPSRRTRPAEGEQDGDIRCTFYIPDVAHFLLGLSSRASTSLTDEQRRHLGIAGDILASLPVADEVEQKDDAAGHVARGHAKQSETQVGQTGKGAQKGRETSTRSKTPTITQNIPSSHPINTGRDKPVNKLISSITHRPGGQIIINKGRFASASEKMPIGKPALIDVHTGGQDISTRSVNPNPNPNPNPIPNPTRERRLHKRDIAALDRLEQYSIAHTALLAEITQAETQPVGKIPSKHVSAIRKYHKALQRLEEELRTGKRIPEVVAFLKGLPKGGVLAGQKILDQLPGHMAIPSDNPYRTQEAPAQTTIGPLKMTEDAIDRLIGGQHLGNSHIKVLVAAAKRELGIVSEGNGKKGRLAKRNAKVKANGSGGGAPTSDQSDPKPIIAAPPATTSGRTAASSNTRGIDEFRPRQVKRSYDMALGKKADIDDSADGWPPKVMPCAEVEGEDGDTARTERTSKRAKHNADDPASGPSDSALVADHAVLSTTTSCNPDENIDTRHETLPNDIEPVDAGISDSQTHPNIANSTPISVPKNEPGPIAEALPDLREWSDNIFLHLRIPPGGRGHLTFLVVKQIYQDLRAGEAQSQPSHIGEAVLTKDYPVYLKKLALLNTEPNERVVVELAMAEAKRFIRVRANPLIENIPQPPCNSDKTPGPAFPLPPLEKCQVSHETAVALATIREKAPTKNQQPETPKTFPQPKPKKGQGTKRKHPEVSDDSSAQPLRVVIEGSSGDQMAGQSDWRRPIGMKKQKKMYAESNGEAVMFKHLPTLAELGSYKDEEWV